MMEFKDLIEKEFYVVSLVDKYNIFDNQSPSFVGIAQLTRIDSCDTCDYDVYHFKHNKSEYLYYDYSKSNYSEKLDYRNTVIKVFEIQSGSPKHPFYHNSRIRLNNLDKDTDGNYVNTYYPRNYHPNSHIN